MIVFTRPPPHGFEKTPQHCARLQGTVDARCFADVAVMHSVLLLSARRACSGGFRQRAAVQAADLVKLAEHQSYRLGRVPPTDRNHRPSPTEMVVLLVSRWSYIPLGLEGAFVQLHA